MRFTTDYFVRNLEHLMAQNGLSPKLVAEAIGVKRQAIEALLSGRSKSMKPLNLVNAARLLGHSAEDLVTRDLRRAKSATGDPIPAGESVLDWLKKLPTEYKPAEKGEIRSALDHLQTDLQDGSRQALKAARIVNLLYSET